MPVFVFAGLSTYMYRRSGTVACMLKDCYDLLRGGCGWLSLCALVVHCDTFVGVYMVMKI